MHVTNFSKCTYMVRYFAFMAIRMVMNLQKNLICFFAETRFLQSLIMSGVQFHILIPSFLNVDLRLSEPYLTKSLPSTFDLETMALSFVLLFLNFSG